MPVRDRPSLIALRAVMAPSGTRRAVLVGTLVLLERSLAPVTAWIVVARGIGQKILVATAFGVLFTSRSLAQRVFMARTEADLIGRFAAGVLEGDVLASGILPDEDVRFEATQAVYHTSQVLSQTLPNLVGDAVACVLVGLVVAAIEPPRLVALAVAITLVAAASLLISRRAVAKTVERAWKVQERVYEVLGNALDGRLEIVAAGQGGAFLRVLGASAAVWSAASGRLAGATVLSGRLALAVIAGFVAVALVLDSRVRGSFVLPLTDVAVFASVTPAFAGVAQGIHALARDARWVALVARVIGAARPSRAALHRASPASALPALPAVIAFDRLSFRYAGAPRDALSEVSLTWSGRETLALAGANGSGKSTLLRLLLALASPTAGTIRIGGVALDSLDADTWRARVAFLPQRPYFPPRADVRAAVRWPVSEAGDVEIRAALDRVGLTTALDVRVDALSVGQRQRVALARLLCRNAALFLLDEPDANLDRAGIALVAELVRELSARGMVAYAAHTPELLDVADRVVTLDAGRIAVAAASALA